MLLPIVLVAALTPALDAAEAEAKVAEAMILHAEGKLAEASEALARAYAIYPDRDYLYMRGIIEREAGRCDIAVELFEAFLAESPPLVDVEATQVQLDACAGAMPEQPAAEPEPVPPRPVLDARSQPVLDTPLVASEDRAPPSSWKNPTGGALVGSGVVLAMIGGGLVGGAAAHARAADRAETAGEYRRGIATARGLNGAGIGALGVGVSVVVGGIVHYVVRSRRARRSMVD